MCLKETQNRSRDDGLGYVVDVAGDLNRPVLRFRGAAVPTWQQDDLGP
jgi:hypothetical protein